MTDVARQATRGRRRSAWRRLAVVLVVPVTLLVAAMIVGAAVWVGSVRRPGREIAALRAAGKPTTIEEIARPVSPDRDALPLWLRAAGIVQAGDPNAYKCDDWSDPRQVSAVIARAHKDAAAFEYARQAARRPECRLIEDTSHLYFDLEAANKDEVFRSFEEMVTRYARSPAFGMLVLSQALGATATATGLTGRQDEAADRLRIGFALSRHICDSPTTKQIKQAAEQDELLLGAARSLDSALSQQAARDLSAEIASLDYGAALSRALNADLCFGLARMRYSQIHPWRSTTLAIALGEDGSPVRHAAAAGYVVSPAYVAETARYIRTYTRAAAMAARPWRATHGSWSPRVVGGADAERFRDKEYLAEQVKSSTGLVRTRDEAIARRGLLQAALALHQYKAKHGAYPKALSEVRIEGLPIPEDVFSGKPFVYHRAGDGFVLYSVGTNLKDDGGTDDPESGDIVWDVAPVPLGAAKGR